MLTIEHANSVLCVQILLISYNNVNNWTCQLSFMCSNDCNVYTI